jgi:tryptophanyl-tRNA synthetase
MANNTTVVSGIRSTGFLHLGNYFGAVKQFLDIQEQQQCYFFIADLHSLTTHPKPDDFFENTKQVLAEYLACGLDPEKAVIYRQSDINEITELYLYFNMIAYLGELERVPTFKEKARQQPDNVNAGLLTYPTLMAADILIHKGERVPVGRDQEQNLEMARKFARRFNELYDQAIFPEPQPYQFEEQELVKIPGLDGSGKMGKSEGEGNAVFINDEPEVIRKKVMRAVTDSGPTAENQPKSAEVQNLFTLVYHISGQEAHDYHDEQYRKATVRYGDMKKQLAQDLITFTEPLRERIRELMAEPEYLRKVATEGAEQARASARHTIEEVRHAVGHQSF